MGALLPWRYTQTNRVSLAHSLWGRVPGRGVGGGRRRCPALALRARSAQRRENPFPQLAHSDAGECRGHGPTQLLVRVLILEQTGTKTHDHRQSGNERAP
jgi:hypothetical protein